MFQAYSSTAAGAGVHLTPGYVGCRGHMPQPITMVQCCGTGEEERWDTTLLCRFLQTQCTYQEGFLSTAADTGSIGEHSWCCTFLYNGFQEQVLAGQNGPESQQYTAFTVGNLGFYKFTGMPFGLCNVPMTFQHLMQNTLGELNLTYCIIYLDDVTLRERTPGAATCCIQML